VPELILVCLQVLLGFLYANGVEWVVHKYGFHGLGRHKGHWLSSHWHHHHSIVRKTRGYDTAYLLPIKDSNGSRKEILELFFMALLHVPLFWFIPYFAATLWVHAIVYFLIHRQSHINPEWAKKYVPWHYDHHMSKNQHANWCVTVPIWDHILNTRVYYLGTSDYTLDENRYARRRRDSND
jgi:hypothetical protein